MTTHDVVTAVEPTAQAARLTDLLDGRWAAVRDEARGQLGRIDLHLAPELTLEQRRERIGDLMHELAASGLHRLGFLPEYGGGGDIGGSINLLQIIGHAELSLLVKAGVHWGLFGGAIQALGTSRHHERYLRAAIELDLPGCFAMTETGHGSNVQRLGTTATYDPATEQFVVHTPDLAARKDYIGNAARDGRMAVVFAQLITGGRHHGVHALMVPIRDAAGRPFTGVHISDCGPKAGLNGVDNGRLSFDHVRVPREALLNRYGDVAPDGTYTSSIDNANRRFFTMLGTLVGGRIAVAGGAGAATQTALAIAVRYGLARRQFSATDTGDEIPLLDYLVHQRKLLPALATSYALQFAQQDLVGMLESVHARDGDTPAHRELESRAAGLKAVATWHATSTIQTCREACGGAGYLAENLLPQLKADSDVFTTFEGDNTVLLQLVAKNLLTGYRDRIRSLDPRGMARFAARTAAGIAAEWSGARTVGQRLRPGGLRDRNWQRALFADRAEHVLAGLARRLRTAGADGVDAFVTFNAAQDHVLRAARVHVDHLVLESFVAAIDRCSDPDTALLLDDVCDLYVLTNIEADRAWFLEHGRVSRGQAKAVTQTVNELCSRLRPHAATLVDGFGIPEAWLSAPIVMQQPIAEAVAS
jgi:acyl-CoA oxidase